jgi:RNA polymerase sigma-70 factor (ECF subfamily)
LPEPHKEAGRQEAGVDRRWSGGESEQFQVPPTAHRDFEAMDDREKIAAILESLPSTLRVPLVMRDMDEISYEEIATSLHIGLSAVKMRIKRAREEFRRRYASA